MGVVFFTQCHNAATKQKEFSLYEVVSGWPSASFSELKQVTGIGIDTNQNILLFVRTGRRWSDVPPDSLISNNTVFVFDNASGKLLNSWGANFFLMPHGLTVDHENNVWLTDVALQQVFKFSHDGKLLMTLGVAKTPGNDSLHFDMPTDVAVAKDGSFYVSDGYGNSRVVKFSKEGKYLFEWGKKGKAPGQFDIPHGIDLDDEGNVYVADRENNRVQKFNSNGSFLAQWKNDRAKQLYYVLLDRKTNNLFATEFFDDSDSLNKGSDLMQFNSQLNLLGRFGRSLVYSNTGGKYHDMAIDRDGNIFTCDIRNNTIQKFQKVVH